MPLIEIDDAILVAIRRVSDMADDVRCQKDVDALDLVDTWLDSLGVAQVDRYAQ